MKPFRSIRWRLQMWYGALLAAVLVGLGVTAYEVEAKLRSERVDDELERLAFAVSAAGRPTPRRIGAEEEGDPPRRESGQPKLAEVLSPADVARGFYFAVWRKNQPPRFTASAGAPADMPQPPDRTPQGIRQRGPRREFFLSSNPGDIALVGRSIEGDTAAIGRFGWLLAGGGLAVFAVAMTIGWWLVTRALRPIQDISRAAGKIATGDLAQRIDTRDTESELGQMADVLNSTFARLEASFAQQARFTADAAHELRTPVTVILMHAQNALAAGGLTGEQREAVEACERAAQRMRRMIQSLLQLARLDAGQEAMERGQIDLAGVAGECAALIQPIAAARGVTIQTEFATAECRADEGRIGQVITNLLGNAIHHGREGGRVWVTTRREADWAVLTVADDGPGIAEEHRPHLFERFFRVDRARTGASGRTGLGLTIAKAIVDAQGGTITVSSVVGEGATFTVRLPTVG